MCQWDSTTPYNLIYSSMSIGPRLADRLRTKSEINKNKINDESQISRWGTSYRNSSGWLILIHSPQYLLITGIKPHLEEVTSSNMLSVSQQRSLSRQDGYFTLLLTATSRNDSNQPTIKILPAR